MPTNRQEHIIVHHTASSRDNTSVAQIDAWHRTRWPFFRSQRGYYIGYHKVISANGIVTTTRNDGETGAHARTANNMNAKSIGICVVGNFESEQPTQNQLSSLTKLIADYRFTYKIPVSKVLAHRNISQTLCCGRNLYLWLNEHKISLLKPVITPVDRPLSSQEVDLRYRAVFHRLPFSHERNFWTDKQSTELDEAFIRDYESSR